MGNNLLCEGTLLKCSYGSAPASLVVLPTNKVTTCNLAAANTMDNIAMVNVPTFGTCSSMSNPVVAAASAAAMGALTPMPCIPMIAAPWTPGSPQVTIANMPVLTKASKCMCSWGGMIEVNEVPQATVSTG